MNKLTAYQEVCKDIDYYTKLIEGYEQEYDTLYHYCEYHETVPIAPFDRIVERMYKIEDMSDQYRKILNQKEKLKKELENKLSEYDTIEYKVAYMRDIQGKSLMEIAIELNYSYIWIRQISSKINKRTMDEQLI